MSLTSVTRWWRCLFGLYGIRISFYEVGLQTAKKGFYFFPFFILQLVVNSLSMVSIVYKIVRNPTLDNFALQVNMPIAFVSSAFTAVVFYKRRNRFNELLDKLTKPMAQYSGVKQLWKSLKLVVLFFIVHFILYEACKVYNCVHTIKSTNLTQDLMNCTAKSCEKTDLFGYVMEAIFHCNPTLWAYSVFFNLVVGIVLFVQMCHLLSINFNSLKTKAELHLSSQQTVRFDEITRLHVKHKEICLWVGNLSSLFSPMLAIWSCIGLVGLCFKIRAAKAILSSSDLGAVADYVVFMMRDLGLMFLLHKYAASVNVHAKDSAYAIAALKLECQKPESQIEEIQEDVAQTNFIQQFSGSTIGINVSGLYTITHGSILSMMGTLLTYVIILYQTS